MRSVMQHSFSRAPSVDIPRSSFNRSHGHKTTMDCDYIIPVLVDPILPGDSISLNMSFFARLNTLEWPLLDNLFLDSHFFFVPNRLVWPQWEKFCGAQDNPDDSIAFTIPKVDSNSTFDLKTNGNRLFQYMGMPWVNSLDLTEINTLPFRGYNLIWNEWYRDQNLQDSVTVYTQEDGPDSHTYFSLLKRGKRHDYFTSCLPAPQKGDAMDLPLGTTAPVVAEGTGIPTFDADDSTNQILRAGNVSGNVKFTSAPTSEGNVSWNDTALEADLSGATAATINELRQAFQIQRLLERDARSGTRYRELLLAHFKVDNSDYRLQRPEYLGGGTTPITIKSVETTAGIGNKPYVGDLGAYGVTAGSHGFTKSFTEHGYLFALVSVRADITYQQGVERHWFHDTRYDIYWPVLSNIGEVAVLNREIYYTNSATDEQAFGYQEAYSEYRYKPSRITGKLASNDAASLDVWHLSEDFQALPALGDTFIQSNAAVPVDRALLVPAEPHLLADFYFDYKCARPMPLYGIPGMIDHF